MTETQPTLPRVARRGTPWTRFLRRLDGSDFALSVLAILFGWYIRLVRATTRYVYEPGHSFEIYRAYLPLIGTTWHGNLTMMASIPPMAGVPVSILVSNHRDGEIGARVAQSTGYTTIRGSGGTDTNWVKKGAVSGFLRLRSSLEAGSNVFLTAEQRRRDARAVGLGSLVLARATGRPLIGLGLAASRSIVLKSWDRSVLPLPFGRIVMVPTPLFRVRAQATDAEMQETRRTLEDALNAATRRAHEIADGRAR